MSSVTNGCQEQMERQLAPTTDTLHEARNTVTTWVSQFSAYQARLADIELVVSELASNAIAASDSTPYTVAGTVDSASLRIRVANRSDRPLPPPEDWAPDNVLAPSGRGLSIAKGIADDLHVATRDGMVEVTAIFHKQP